MAGVFYGICFPGKMAVSSLTESTRGWVGTMHGCHCFHSHAKILTDPK